MTNTFQVFGGQQAHRAVSPPNRTMLREVAGGSPRKLIPSDGASGSPASEKNVAEEEPEVSWFRHVWFCLRFRYLKFFIYIYIIYVYMMILYYIYDIIYNIYIYDILCIYI